MNKVKKYLNLILMLTIINVFMVSNVIAATNPYNQAGPYGTNCTWYAWKIAYEKAGVALPGWGNAKQWYNDAASDGYTVGTTPKPNSIIVWGDWTFYGHVGYVEKVEGNILHIWDSTGPCIDEEDPEYIACMANSVCEETDRACKQNAKRIACQYDITASSYSITGYVYLDYAPKKTTSQSNKKTEISTSQKVIKSNNANLSKIELSVGTIEFDKDITEYSIEVESDIEMVTIVATPEDKKATVKGAGDYELSVGLNDIKLVVTAEDSSTKEYIIHVTRKEKFEIENNLDINKKEEEKAIPKRVNYEPIIIISASFIVILGACITIFFKWKKHNKK